MLSFKFHSSQTKLPISFEFWGKWVLAQTLKSVRGPHLAAWLCRVWATGRTLPRPALDFIRTLIWIILLLQSPFAITWFDFCDIHKQGILKSVTSNRLFLWRMTFAKFQYFNIACLCNSYVWQFSFRFSSNENDVTKRNITSTVCISDLD